MSDRVKDPVGASRASAAVVDAIRRVQELRSLQTLDALSDILEDALLLVPVPSETPDNEASLSDEEPELTIVLQDDDDGLSVLAFTSAETFFAWNADGSNYVALPSVDIFEMAREMDADRVVLDPGSDVWCAVERDDYTEGDDEVEPTEVSEDQVSDTVVYVGRPSTPPHPDALRAVVATLMKEPHATGAWYFQMFAGSTPELAIAIQFREGTDGDLQQEAIQRVADGASALSAEASTIVFVNAGVPGLETVVSGVGERILLK